jgi:hypothetical protein
MMNERVTDLTTYLKVLVDAQNSGYKCNGEIAEVIRELRFETGVANTEDKAGLYHRKIVENCGDCYNKDKRFVNAQIYNAYMTGVNGTIFLPRCSGTTTSIKALAEVFDDVVYFEDGRCNSHNYTDKVVFIERQQLVLPRGSRPKCVIIISQIDFTGSKEGYYEAIIK